MQKIKSVPLRLLACQECVAIKITLETESTERYVTKNKVGDANFICDFVSPTLERVTKLACWSQSRPAQPSFVERKKEDINEFRLILKV